MVQCNKHSHKPSKNCNKDPSKCQWDYVIVGAGTAGCALAAKLSDPNSKTGKFDTSVLVLESGTNETTNPLLLNVSQGLFSTFSYDTDTQFAHPYVAFPGAVPSFPGDIISQGRTWGGSSQINNILAVRGTPSIYNAWAELSGNNRWLYDNMLDTVMKPLEHFTPNSDTPIEPVQRGFNGPVFITQETPPIDSDPFQNQLAAGFGTTIIPDYNDPIYGDTGVSNSQDEITPPFLGSNSVRSSSGAAFLTGEPSVGVPAIVDKNGNGLNGRKLKIISEATVNKILFSCSNRAKAVEYFLANDPNQLLHISAKKKIILCAGGIQTPAILQRSGVGDASLLKALNIPVVYDNANVGKHLQTHLFGQAIINDTTLPFPSYTQGFFDIPASTGTTNQRIMQSFNVPTVAFFPSGIANAVVPPITQGVDIIYGVITPKSEGSVQIVRDDPTIDPHVFLNFLSDGGSNVVGSDSNKVVNFLKELKAAFPAAYPGPGSVLYPLPQDYAAGDDALLATYNATPLITYHYSRTCQMAQSPADGVVDGNLQVFGVDGLMIADNSIQPIIINGNTSLAAYYIGLMAARILKGL
jgi:choline dehydrogenase